MSTDELHVDSPDPPAPSGSIRSGLVGAALVTATRPVVRAANVDGPVKVLYISGRGRSGSTMLDTLLGQVEGVFNIGEMRLWNRRWRADADCGCGTRLQRCEVWQAVLEQAFGTPHAIEAAAQLHESGNRQLYYPLTFSSAGLELLRAWLRDYLHNLTLLYEAIHAVTGCEVIVDSSKSPTYGYLLSMLPGIEFHVVHLVRDPRAVAYSWMRQKRRAPVSSPISEDPLYRRHLGPVGSTLRWDVANLCAARLVRGGAAHGMTLRYEDFVRAPKQALVEVLALAGLEDRALPFHGESDALVAPRHTVSGNPNRFQSGVVRLSADEEWVEAMSESQHRLVSVLALPWLARYGYD